MSAADDDIGRLTYRDLLELRIVNNRGTLRNWILYRGFPPGRLTGPNSRTWSRAEIRDYIESCPVKPRASVMPPARRRRGNKNPASQPDRE
jgi:predicted DNA-binding transcriptional regulator AlpA